MGLGFGGALGLEPRASEEEPVESEEDQLEPDEDLCEPEESPLDEPELKVLPPPGRASALAGALASATAMTTRAARRLMTPRRPVAR